VRKEPIIEFRPASAEYGQVAILFHETFFAAMRLWSYCEEIFGEKGIKQNPFKRESQ
jgi:hypothetical protein